MKLESIERDILKLGWFIASLPLLCLICVGVSLSKANMILCRLYFKILMED